MLYREPKLLKDDTCYRCASVASVSVLYREPKLLKGNRAAQSFRECLVSVLYREPKLLKDLWVERDQKGWVCFSALP